MHKANSYHSYKLKFMAFGFFGLLISNVLLATKEKSPPINSKSIIGTWEAISTTDWRVYRMEIGEDTDASFLSYSMTGLTINYRLKKMSIDKGEISLLFDGIDDKIKITGKGVANTEEAKGILYVNLSRNSENAPSSTIHQLTFFQRNPSFIESLAKLSNSAKMAIEEMRRGKFESSGKMK